MKDKIVGIKARAFTGQGVRLHKVAVSEAGEVRVWDEVAGHFTLCHRLCTSAEARIRKMAAGGMEPHR